MDTNSAQSVAETAVSREVLEQHAALVTDFGGPKKLSEFIRRRFGSGPTPAGISFWKTNGIPWNYRPFIAAEATVRGFDLPADFLIPSRKKRAGKNGAEA